MHTFDKVPVGKSDPKLEDVANSEIPDEVEVGESDLYWVNVRRSTKMIELVSKHTGAILSRVAIEDAAMLGISEKQIECARRALAL